MTSNGGEEDFLDFWSDIVRPSIEKHCSTEGFPNNVHDSMVRPSNGGHGHSSVSTAQNNNAHAPDHQYAQLAVGTPPAQIPPNHSSVPICSSNGNLMDSISTVRQSANPLLPSLEDSQVSDYGYLQPSSSLPRSGTMLDQVLRLGHSAPESGTILDLELRMGHSVPRRGTILDLELRIGQSAHNVTASSYNPDNTRHGREGYHHDNHPNMMTASDDVSCMRAGMDIAHTRNNQAIFNQVNMEHHSGLASSSNPHLDLVLGLPSSSSYYPTTNDHAGHRPDDERYNSRNNQQSVMMTSSEPCTNDVNAHNGHDGLVDAELVSNPHQEGSSTSSVDGESSHK